MQRLTRCLDTLPGSASVTNSMFHTVFPLELQVLVCTRHPELPACHRPHGLLPALPQPTDGQHAAYQGCLSTGAAAYWCKAPSADLLGHQPVDAGAGAGVP